MNDDIDCADVFIAEHFVPRLSAICAAVNAALLVRCVEMSDRCNEQHVRISRIDSDLSNVLRVVEADVLPRLAGIDGLVHAIPVTDGIAESGFAASDIHGIRLRWRDCNGTDRSHWHGIENRKPHPATVD
jgi:hypothetical protein